MRRKILFVDDDQVLQRVMESQLAEVRSTYTLTTASNGVDAIKKLENTYYSLVVIDMVMSEKMDGLNLLVHIKKKYPDVGVILVSEQQDVQMQSLVESTEAVGCLEKPYLVSDLSKLILSYLRSEADGGVMYNVSPPVFLQLMEMEGRTCTIRLIDEKSEQGGILYFLDGELLDARIGELTGLEATYSLFGWDSVTVLVRNDCQVMENAINSDLQAIILKAVGLKDEYEEVGENGDGQSSLLLRIKKLVQKERGAGVLPEILAPDVKIKNVVSKLMEISVYSGINKPNAAFIHNENNMNTVILPSQQVVVQGKMSPSLSNEITQLLCSNV